MAGGRVNWPRTAPRRSVVAGFAETPLSIGRLEHDRGLPDGCGGLGKKRDFALETKRAPAVFGAFDQQDGFLALFDDRLDHVPDGVLTGVCLECDLVTEIGARLRTCSAPSASRGSRQGDVVCDGVFHHESLLWSS